MVEKGMDPASVFEMCDDDDEEMKEPGAGAASAASEGLAAVATTAASAAATAAPLPSGSENITTTVRHRRRGKSLERVVPKSKRESWIDPPEERESGTLTQAEIESCMQTYEVGSTSAPTNMLLGFNCWLGALQYVLSIITSELRL